VITAIRVKRLAPGDKFDEDEYERAKSDIVRKLTDLGYAYAKVKAHADVDVSRHTAEIVIEVDPGKRARYGPVRIVGLDEVPEGPVRDNLGLVEGEEYSRSDVEDAHTALVNLGVFATIDIKQDCRSPNRASFRSRSWSRRPRCGRFDWAAACAWTCSSYRPT